jgi:hypothetical protein
MSRPVLAARLRLAARVVVLSLLTLAVFWAVAFLLTLLTAWVRGLPLTAAMLLSHGAVCGLIAALFVIVFHIKREVIRLPVPRREPFVERVKAHLRELGYTLTAEVPDRLAFRPSFRSVLFGAGIEVRLTGDGATLTGAKVYLEVLRRRLRLQSYVDRAEHEGRLLRRVELSMRLTPEQLPRVPGAVAEALRGADAQVVCHLSLLARGAAGIRDAAVEEAVRGRLEEEGIAVEMHKEPLSAPRSPAGPHSLRILAGTC